MIGGFISNEGWPKGRLLPAIKFDPPIATIPPDLEVSVVVGIQPPTVGEMIAKRVAEITFASVQREEFAREFVLLWESLRDSLGAAGALRDPRLKAARNRYRLSRGESTI